MGRWEQYEIWVEKAGKKWEMLCLFPDVALATAVASKRTGRVRMIQIVYENDKMVSQEIVADLGHFEAEVPQKS
jgi:hypothetical protein